ncbi:APH domain-containing protein [Fusarium sp. Ph1]|nr:APH domain-containing protein [Fusarium sp. Ph1]
MDSSPTPTLATYTVSCSRGKQPGDSLYLIRLRERRKVKGQARSSDESGSEDKTELGAVALHKMLNRKVVLHPDNTVVKFGKHIAMGEADALRVAVRAGIPVPAVNDAHTAPDGQVRIHIGYVQVQTLDTLGPEMSVEQKRNIAHQLRGIVEKMRAVTPPPDLTSLYEDTTPLVREALSRRLRTDHRIVFTHCDLTPRNILVQDGKIQGLVDWEDSGWYPEYWEYVKFFQRTADKDWKQYAGDIFPELYHDELVDFMAMSKLQNS